MKFLSANFIPLLPLIALAVSSHLHSQACVSHSVSIESKHYCPCNNTVGYAGGCQADPVNGQYCVILNYYPCSTKCSQTFAFTANEDECIYARKPENTTAVFGEGDPEATAAIISLSSKESAASPTCDSSNEAFETWLAKELRARRGDQSASSK
jgi:hypothetical protein